MKENFNINNNSEDFHLEKRKFLYEKLEEKVESILELRSFAKNHEKDNLDDLEVNIKLKQQKLLDDYFSRGFITMEEKGKLASFPEIIREGHELSQLLMKEEAKANLTSSNEQEYNQKRAQFEKEEKRLDEIMAEYVAEESNIDLNFLKKAGVFLDTILLKKQTVIEMEEMYKTSPEEFYATVQEQCGLDMTVAKDNYNVSFPGYSIVIELSEVDFNQWTREKGTQGVKIAGTAFIILKDTEGKEKTLNHEENHNLSESFVPDVQYADIFSQRIGLILEMNDEVERRLSTATTSEKQDLIKAKEYVKINLPKLIDNYAFENFSEIIADIDRLGDKEINTYLWNYIEWVNKIEEIAEKTGNEEIKAILEQGLRTSRLQFVDYINKLSNIFFVSEKLGEIDQAKGAIILFKHKQINKAEKYLKHHFGEEKYNTYKSLQPLISGGVYFKDIEKMDKLFKDIKFMSLEGKKDIGLEDFNLKAGEELMSDIIERNGLPAFLRMDNLRNLALSLKEHTIDLSEEEKSNLRESVLKTSWLESVIFNKYEAKDLGEIDTYLKEIGEHLGIDELKEITEEKISVDLVSCSLFKCFSKKNYDSLLEAYNIWPFGKSLFQFALVKPFIKMLSFMREEFAEDKNFIEFLEKIEINQRIKEIILEKR